MSRASRHSQPERKEISIADVLAQAISAIQLQKIPAEQAVKAARESVAASQKAALDLLLYAAQAQAEVVHELLADNAAKPRAIIEGVGSLLLDAMTYISGAQSPDGSRNKAASPKAVHRRSSVKTPRKRRDQAASGGNGKAPSPEPRLSEAEMLDAVVRAIAEGYSARQPGGAVAHSIGERYPSAIPVMQQYLAMDDFLVLMWLRQQPPLANLAAEPGFSRFYAELKNGVVPNQGTSPPALGMQKPPR